MAKSRKKSVRPAAEAPGAPQNAGDTTAAAADRERIARRAYELYERRHGTSGDALDDWLAAEREVAGERGKSED